MIQDYHKLSIIVNYYTVLNNTIPLPDLHLTPPAPSIISCFLKCFSHITVFSLTRKPWALSIRPKFPEIPVQNRIEQTFSRNSFRKFRFTSRGCPFFLEIWKFRKFPVPFGISTRFRSAPVSLVVKSYKMAASLSSRHSTLHWMQNDLL